MFEQAQMHDKEPPKNQRKSFPKIGMIVWSEMLAAAQGVYVSCVYQKNKKNTKDWTTERCGILYSKQIGLNQTKWADLNLAQTFSNPSAERSYLDPPKLGIASPGRPRAQNDCPYRGMACHEKCDCGSEL